MLTMARNVLKNKAPKLYSAARYMRLRGERALFREYVAQHSFGGHELSVIISDRVARAWYGQDLPRPSAFDLLAKRNFLRKGARVFAIGAHQAIISMILAREAGEGRIVAVEGNGENHSIGVRNLQLNQINNVLLLHAAVAAHDGLVAFSLAHNGMVELNQDGPSVRPVRAVTIDTLARIYGDPDVVMLDIEGYEAHAIEGATKVLKSNCAWYIEVHEDRQLARYGKSKRDVVTPFGCDFELLVSPDEVSAFVPASNQTSLREGRWFLVAMPKSSARQPQVHD